MAIQHRQIPDSELHEPKGADAAIAGSLLKATGTGSTSFDFIEVGQLKGAVANVENRLLVIGPTGTFKSITVPYASFTSSETGGVTTTTKQLGTDSLYVSGIGFKVTDPGVYQISFASPTFLVGDGDTEPYELTRPTLRNVTTGLVVFSGAAGLVELNVTDTYVSGQANSYSLVKVL